MLRNVLALVMATLAALQAETAMESFAGAAAGADWTLHQEGKAVARVAEGVLVLDLAAPEAGKTAWAEFVPWLRLPATIEWRQTIRRDSPHLYHAGLYLTDLAGGLTSVGLGGQPLGHHAQAAGKAGTMARPAGEWSRFRVEIARDWRAAVTVSGEAGEERFDIRLPALRGALLHVGFFHNQPRNQGQDAYDQDRGVSAIDDVRIEAAAFYRGDPATFRDRDWRAMDTRVSMAFNRAMRWLPLPEAAGGGALPYDATACVRLTGSGAAADWLTNRGCALTPVDAESSNFRRPNDLDGPDSAAIPILQWCLRQHPYLDYELVPGGGAARLSVVLPCIYLGRGITLFETASATTPQRGRVDLAERFAAYGLAGHAFGEIGLYLDQERGQGTPESTCGLRLSLGGPGGLITGPAVVRTAQQAAAGVAVAALVAGPDGQLLTGDAIRVTGNLEGAEVILADADGDGVHTAVLNGLQAGTHGLALTAQSAGLQYTAGLEVSVTAMPFVAWSAAQPTYSTAAGEVLPTMLGDLLAWVPLLNAAAPERRVIASAEQWRALSAPEQKAVSLVKLRTLSRAELGAMLDAYATAGVRAIRLVPNVSPCEAILDAGGHAAPHALETLAWTLAECRARGIRALINLFHYPYGSPGTGSYPPWRQYAEAGYTGPGSFFTPATGRLLRGYLAEVLAVTRNDPAVLGYSLTGENDQAYPPEWINDLFAFVREHDPNHPVTLEQGGGILQRSGGVPWSYAGFAPVKSAGIGYRTYYTGGLETDAYMMICGRAYRSNPPAFMAEVASGPGWYGAFHRTWQHPDFLTKVRDAHWMAALCQHTLSLCWAAPWAQVECRVPQRCLEQIDWRQFRREVPATGLRLKAVTAALIPRLAAWERLLASQAIDYDYVWTEAPPGFAVGHYESLLEAEAAPGLAAVPQAVLERRPLSVSAGHSASLLLSRAPLQALALVRNTAEYRPGPGYGEGVNENHRQRSKALPLTITFGAVPKGTRFKVYDLETRNCCSEGVAAAGETIDLGTTAMDAAVLLSELPMGKGW